LLIVTFGWETSTAAPVDESSRFSLPVSLKVIVDLAGGFRVPLDVIVRVM
jgi:hypothetical protein